MWKGEIDVLAKIAAGGTDYLTFDLPQRIRKVRMTSDNDTTTVSMYFEIKYKGKWYPLFELTTSAAEEVGVCTIDTEIEGVGLQIRVGQTTSVAADVLKSTITYEKWVEDE